MRSPYSCDPSIAKATSGTNRVRILWPSSCRTQPVARFSVLRDSAFSSSDPIRDTKTRACLRSGVSVTPVTVTNPIRLSFMLRDSIRLISCWI